MIVWDGVSGWAIPSGPFIGQHIASGRGERIILMESVGTFEVAQQLDNVPVL